MSSLENTGFVIKDNYRDNAFTWDLPYCIMYGSSHVIDHKLIPGLNFQFVSSPWFLAFNRQWRLALVLDIESSFSFGLFLWMMPSSVKAPDIKVKLSIIRKDAGEYKSCEGDLDSEGNFGSWKFISLRDLSHSRQAVSPNGVLRIFCLLKKNVPKNVLKKNIRFEDLESDSSSTSNDSETAEESALNSEIAVSSEDETSKNNALELEGVDRLVANLKSLLLDEQSSDVLLKIEDREFKAHKAILKVRSPVFASMFQPNTKESTTGVVDIADCSASAFEIFLLYVYTGSADSIAADNVFDLYYAADKYEMNDLKAKCVEFMKDNLSVDNFCDVVTLSLRHSETRLKNIATQFFCDNVKTIIKTVQWQKYLKEYATYANELIIKAFDA